jgi:hypothetical protein
MGKFFFKILAKLASSLEFSLAKSENNWPKIEKKKKKHGLVREKKILVRLASGFVYLFAKPEFYSHLASWRVVIRTSANTSLTRTEAFAN